MFYANGGKGFSMSFASGLTISVQFGYGNYCENRHNQNQRNNERSLQAVDLETSSQNAEIAIWETESGNWVTNNFIDCHGDEVIGYLSADQVAALIAKVASIHE